MIAKTSVTAWTTGKSRWKIELIISWPIPGKANTCSITSVPPTRKPMLTPRTETVEMTAFRSACWYSWAEQTRSMEKLRQYDFEWVLPGHGRIHHDDPENMRRHLERCVEWMKTR